MFQSVVDLQTAINRFIAEHNQSPRALLCRADPDAVIAARNRGFQVLESNHRQSRQTVRDMATTSLGPGRGWWAA